MFIPGFISSLDGIRMLVRDSGLANMDIVSLCSFVGIMNCLCDILLVLMIHINNLIFVNVSNQSF